MTTDLPTAQVRADHAPVTGTRARIIGLDGARGLSCLGVAVMHITGHYSSHTAAAWKTNVLAETEQRLGLVRTIAAIDSGEIRPLGPAGFLLGACSVNDVVGSLLPKTASCR